MSRPTAPVLIALVALPLLMPAVGCDGAGDFSDARDQHAGAATASAVSQGEFESLTLWHSSPQRLAGRLQLGVAAIEFDASLIGQVATLSIVGADGKPLLQVVRPEVSSGATLGRPLAVNRQPAPAGGYRSAAQTPPAPAPAADSALLARLAEQLEFQGFSRPQYPVLVLIHEVADHLRALPGQADQRPGAPRGQDTLPTSTASTIAAGSCPPQRCLVDEMWDARSCSCQSARF